MRINDFLRLALLVWTSEVAVAHADTVRVLVWDEQAPAQKKAYENFLGNAIAEYLKGRPGIEVRTARLDDPGQGIPETALADTDVVVWWGHGRNGEVDTAAAERVVTRIKEGRIGLVALHSAHWARPFVQAMWAVTTERALASLPAEKRNRARIVYEYPKLFKAPSRDTPLTPDVTVTTTPDGTPTLTIRLPVSCFPAYRNDGKPSHVRTLLRDHPIARDVPEQFDIPQTEMYDEPFHVPAPDAVVFEERWDAGEHFRSGSVWTLGKGKIFYFRPEHETYPAFTQPVPLKIVENAVRFVAPDRPRSASATASKPRVRGRGVPGGGPRAR